MVVVHPLSGVADPSSFDLATGRLCVMASRAPGWGWCCSRADLPRPDALGLPSCRRRPARWRWLRRGRTRACAEPRAAPALAREERAHRVDVGRSAAVAALEVQAAQAGVLIVASWLSLANAAAHAVDVDPAAHRASRSGNAPRPPRRRGLRGSGPGTRPILRGPSARRARSWCDRRGHGHLVVLYSAAISAGSASENALAVRADQVAPRARWAKAVKRDHISASAVGAAELVEEGLAASSRR